MPLNSAYISAVLADSPWGFWQLQETSGTSMADSGGGSHSGVYTAAVESVAGPFSGWTAAHFSNKSATVVGPTQWNGVQCFEMWGLLDPPGTTGCMAFSYTDSGRTLGYGLAAVQTAGSGPNAALGINSPASAWLWTAHPMFSSNGWQYMCLQFEADGHWRAYMRNAAFGLVTDDLGAHGLNALSGANIYIGENGTTGYQFKGSMAAFAFYTHNLTTTQMNAHYDAAAAAPPPAPCQYGTRKKAATTPAVFVTDNFLESLKSLFVGDFWLNALRMTLGTTINADDLCSTLPPVLSPFTFDQILSVGARGFAQLYAMAWFALCECTPGATTPVSPPIPTPTQDGSIPGDEVIVVNATNPCLDLTEVRRMLREILKLSGQDLVLDTTMQRYEVPFATLRATVHAGLTGTGSLPISQLLGVQIAITAHPPGRELEGAPAYVWDLGWISIMDGNGFIQERRITRLVDVWMPRGFQEATILGYVFKTGVTGTITELQPEP